MNFYKIRSTCKNQGGPTPMPLKDIFFSFSYVQLSIIHLNIMINLNPKLRFKTLNSTLYK